MFMIREIPKSERPRERFLKYDIDSIQSHELIAIILRTGSKNESVLELSKRVSISKRSIRYEDPRTLCCVISKYES